MGDTLLALSIPLLVFAGGIYAGCESWWRRRHPAPPSPYTHQAARLAEREMTEAAREIVDEAYATLGALYGAAGAPELAAQRPTSAETIGSTSAPGVPGVTLGATASPGRGRSYPASAQKG
ncbi:hypothetical protein AB0N06_20630 [Streptomyces sp. NPDC051020]|uniref:hypothetical protein n=1 Tax=Streptomyces sp. NPDC051020 TaxID=3155409 RepID=UPI003415768E